MSEPTQLTLFDYDSLDTETRVIVQQRTSEIKKLVRQTAEGIIEIGEKLAEVRDRLAHNKAVGAATASLHRRWRQPGHHSLHPAINRRSSLANRPGHRQPESSHLLALLPLAYDFPKAADIRGSNSVLSLSFWT